MKVKYLSGKRKDQIVDIDDAKAKSLIDDEVVVAVNEEEDAFEASLKSLDSRISDAANKAAEMAATKALDKIAKGIGSQNPRIVVGPERELQDPQGGFKNFSHYLSEVKNSSKAPTETMVKWNQNYSNMIKSTTGNTEGSTSNDAGYAVPVEYQNNIFKPFGNVPDFNAMTFQVPMNTNVCKIPVLKNYDRSNTNVNNGVVRAVISEGSNITQSKTNWEQITLTLAKEAVMVPVSNELLEDNNVALGTVVGEQAAYQIKKAINGGIIAGSSAMTGIISHASTKSVTRTTYDHIKFADVLNMYAAFAHDDADYSNAVWFTSPTCIADIGGMTVTSTGQAIYFPPGGAANGTVATLLGRPLIVTGWCPSIANTGSLLLADMKKYVSGYKGGLTSAVSPHVFFLTDEQAFRFTMRVNGRPGLSGAITLEDGSTTTSPFVQLAHTALAS